MMARPTNSTTGSGVAGPAAPWWWRAIGRGVYRVRWGLTPYGAGLGALLGGLGAAVIVRTAGPYWLGACYLVGAAVVATWIAFGVEGAWDRTRGLVAAGLAAGCSLLVAWRPLDWHIYAGWGLLVPLCGAVLWWWHPGTRKAVHFDRLQRRFAASGPTGARLIGHRWRKGGEVFDVKTADLAGRNKLREGVAEWLDVPPARVVVAEDRDSATGATVTVLDREMFEGPEVAHPALAAGAELGDWAPGGRSILDPVPLGEDGVGDPETLPLVGPEGGNRIALFGKSGSGKSNTFSDLVAGVAPCRDALLWTSDVVKGGATFKPWNDVIDWPATSADETEAQMRALMSVLEERGALVADSDSDVWDVRNGPYIVFAIEEAAALFSRRPDLADLATSLALTVRQLGAALLIASQGTDWDSIPTTLRDQLSAVVCHKLSPGALKLAWPKAYGAIDMSLFDRPGLLYMQRDGGLATADGAIPVRSYALYRPGDKRALAARYAASRPKLDAPSLRAAGPVYAARAVTAAEPVEPVQPKPTRAAARDRAGQLAADALADLEARPNFPAESLAETFGRVEPEPVDQDPAAVSARRRIVELLGDAELAGEGGLSSSEIARRMGPGFPSSQSTVLRRLAELRDEGEVQASGFGKASRWSLVQLVDVEIGGEQS
jgi:hypothetical protein